MIEEKIVYIDGKQMTITNRTPDFSSEEEREKVYKEIERKLYNVFKNYT